MREFPRKGVARCGFGESTPHALWMRFQKIAWIWIRFRDVTVVRVVDGTTVSVKKFK
jgi:hypothetical protein